MIVVLNIQELTMDLSTVADYAVIALAAVVLLATPLILKKLVPWLKSKGYDDEVYAFIDLVDDHFDIVEDLAESTGWKGDEKLVQMMKKLAGDLKRDLTPKEAKIATARASKQARRNKAIRLAREAAEKHKG